MVDLYSNNKRYDKGLKAIQKWNTTPTNKKLIIDYIERHLDKLAPGRRYADLCHIRRIFNGTKTSQPIITQDLTRMTEKEWWGVIKAIKSMARTSDIKRDTFKSYRRNIKGIYTLLVKERPEKKPLLNLIDELLTYPIDVADNISLHKSKYYTQDEFTKILKAARRPQEKALLSLAWETTSRPNEYLSLKVGDVEAMPQGFKFTAHISKKRGGITQTRNLYVITYRAEFSQFWESHPFRNDPAHSLFYREDQLYGHKKEASFGKPLGPAGANKMLKKYDAVSGIKKNGTLYFLRHGGFTNKVLQGMNPKLAGADMGWVPGSKQERRYTHLTDEDVLNERLRLADERYEKEVKPKIKVRICPFCNQENSPASERCAACGQTLDISKVTKELVEMRRSVKEMIKQAVRAEMAAEER